MKTNSSSNEQFSASFCKDTIRYTLLLSLLAVMILIPFKLYDHIRGLIIGTLGSCIDFIFIYMSVKSIEPNNSDRSIRKLRFSVLSRYLVYGIILFSAFEFKNIDIISACVGLFSLRLILFFKYVILFKNDNGSDINSAEG